MTWAELQSGLEAQDVEIRDYSHFLALVAQAGLDPVERQKAYADYRANYAAAVRGWTLNGWQRKRRSGVKGGGRSYSDASTAVDEVAT